MPASSIHVEFSAPGPEVRARLTAAPTTTNRIPARTFRQVRRPPVDCRNRADLSHAARLDSHDRVRLPAGGASASVFVRDVIATVRPSSAAGARALKKPGVSEQKHGPPQYLGIV